MTRSDNSMEKLMAEAERLGKEQEDIDERNRKRRAKGRKPLLDIQEKKDLEVGRRRYRTGDSTTVDGAAAMKLFELRKAAMQDGGLDDPEDADDQDEAREQEVATKAAQLMLRAKGKSDEEKALREAEAARRVQDLKGGRIDHQGNFSEDGQKLAGGDKASLTTLQDAHAIWQKAFQLPPESDRPTPEGPSDKTVSAATAAAPASTEGLEIFKRDLYARLGTSFEALERTLSDLQGRIAEIVTASTPATPEAPVPGSGADEFKSLLERKTPVVFDVGGTQMTFDAICVFHAAPCITLVSRIGSAKITPKPGARLALSYEMDGQTYTADPVTYLGTRFDLPMFGLSFVGFIRDLEADLMDADAGIKPDANPS